MDHPRKSRPDPNIADPLSEVTIGRRIWAAYRRAGYTRATFAAAMRMTYPGIDQIETGKRRPQLETVMRAAPLVGFTIDQLCYGHHIPRNGGETELSLDGIKAALQELRATHEEIEALGEYHRSAAGQFQRFTYSYLEAFVGRFSVARKEGMDTKDAINAAKVAAANARATAEAASLGLTAPPSDARLAAIGLQAQASEAKARNKRVKPAPAGRRKRA